MLIRGLTKEREVDPVLVQQGLYLPLEALHLLVVLVVSVVAACKVIVSSDRIGQGLLGTASSSQEW